MNKNTPILEIKNLKASINANEILKDLNLTVNKGEIHAITVSYTHLRAHET